MAVRTYKVCPVCKNKLRESRFDKHMALHNLTGEEKNGPRNEASELVKCTECNAMIQRRRLNKHLFKVHRIANYENYYRYMPDQPFPSHKLNKESAIELRKALQEGCTIKNKEIADYLKRNPLKDSIGKFGVPQDKYRHGFYGSNTMEYDVWRKGDKEK